jgi:hypothetical protein
MNMTGFLFLAVYLLVFLAALVGMVWWDRRKRRTKPPLPENLRLLRMPGEYLWRRVIRNDESELQWLGAFGLLPILVGAGVLQVVAWCLRSSPLIGLVVALIVFLASLLLCVRWYQRRLQRRADDYLGFFGERYVAEWLDPLKAEGWFIFHDIQCAGATGKFNLDHVAVGPGGVWVVETKTRRKGVGRPGLKAHEVHSDGQRIIWPSGDDAESLEQASDNARWLRDWLAKVTGKSIEVAAVVAVPGYCVIEKKLGAVRLANPKVLPQVLVSRGKNVLTEDDIDVIRRQLEEKCRDVEY